MSDRNVGVIAAICWGAFLSGNVRAQPITNLVPADSLVVYLARPHGWSSSQGPPSSQPSSGPSSGSPVATILRLLDATGLMSDEGQVFADIVSTLSLMGRYEHALVLLDVSSKVVRRPPAGGEVSPAQVSLRLKSLQAAIVFRTRGDHRAVLDVLRRIIGRYTNEDLARLGTVTLDGATCQRLTDDRLPGWAVWEWGRIGECFVVSFGTGAFEKMVAAHAGRSPCLAADEWYRAATIRTRGDRAFAQWFVALARLEQRLANVAKGRHLRVIRALDADNMTHDLWTFGLEGRALTWYRCYRRNGEEVFRRYSDPATSPPGQRRLVPEGARHFAIIQVPTRWLVDNLPRAWMAAQSEGHVQTWQRVWRRLESETGIDIDGNLIQHLGKNVVVFDYPPHPLKIPFALTIAFEIDDRQAVQVAVDALLSAWGRYLDERAKRKGTRLVRVKVRHDEDGIWSLEAGIPGPALKVTDRYVVVSWAPQALRDALKHIEGKGADGPVMP